MMLSANKLASSVLGFLGQLYNPSALGRLLTDKYHFTTGKGYANEGREQNNAVFYLFGRKEGCNGGYTVAAGLELLIDVVKRWQSNEFTDEDVAFLKAQKMPSGARQFTDAQIERFIHAPLKLKIDAAPEGSLVFPQEALVRVEGPVDQAKMLESVALAIFNGQSAYATHAARLTDVLSKPLANGSPTGTASVQGLRRGPSIGAAFEASRALEIGGYTSSSTGAAAKILGQAFAGTMDHAWVMTHNNETADIPMAELFKMRDEGRTDELKQALKNDAFRSFAFSHPEAGILLLDTYDPEKGLDKAITVIKELHALNLGQGYGVRFDSDDLVKYSKLALRRFGEEGLITGLDKEQVKNMSDADLLLHSKDCKSFCAAADGIDEYTAQEMREQGAFFKSWGVGTGGSHVPPLGLVYKASSMFMDVTDGKGMPDGAVMTPVMKVAAHAPVKSSNPGKINSKRFYDENGKLSHVVVYDENLGLDPQGRAAERHNLNEMKVGISSAQSESLLVPVFDANGTYVYKEPPKRETFPGSGEMVTDLAAIAKTVKQQLERLPEGVRRVVRPRDEIIKNQLLRSYKANEKSGQGMFSVDMAAIQAKLPPEVEHIPVYLDYRLVDQRRACEKRHDIIASGKIDEYRERFEGGNEAAIPGSAAQGGLTLQGGPDQQQYVS